MFNREATPTNDKIMKSLTKMLPALGLVLGATLAMAMNFANPVPDTVYTKDPSTGEFIDVSHLQIGEDYDCNNQGECLWDENENLIQSGTFTMRP